MRRAIVVALLGAIAGIAVIVRALGFEYVFVGDEIVFPPADAQYHLRRALYTLNRLPDVLLFDPYINYPGGAAVPWPPLFDFTLGATGWLLGGTQHDLERVAAWAAPACAAIAVGAVYLSGVCLGSRRVGLVAALFFALLPISVVYTRVGNADHHAAVGMIGAWLLYSVLALVDPGASRRRMAGLAGLLFVVRSAMLLTWHGSLLYLAPAEALLLLAGIVSGRPALLAAQAGSALGTLLVIAAMLAVSPTPLGGAYSSIALSRLHVLAIAAVVVTSGGLFVGVRLGAANGPVRRLGWVLLAGAAFLLTLVVLPGPREGLTLAFRFLTLGDEVGAITGEQTPLFAIGAATGGRLLGPPAHHSWGLFAYALPVVAFAGLLAGRRVAPGSAGARAAGLALTGWGLFFCTLASLQRRYGNDAAPAAALSFALLLVVVAGGLVARVSPGTGALTRRRVALAVAALATVALFVPSILAVQLPRARGSWAALGSDGPPPRAAVTSVAYTLHRFAGIVRDVTPETSGFLGDDAGPEYGVIAHANLGHALQYRARRATATDPFWWYIGRENWDRSFAFLDATREREALELARTLGGRYVVTMPGLGADTVMGRLHRNDGDGRTGRPPLQHFRLVAEAPRGGLAIGALFGADSARTTPYKLFEIVPGAIIRVETAPGALVTATIDVRVPSGRRMAVRVVERAGVDGVARLRVVYPTGVETSEPVTEVDRVARATGPYRVRFDGVSTEVEVSDGQIRRGAVVRVTTPPAGSAARDARAPTRRPTDP